MYTVDFYFKNSKEQAEIFYLRLKYRKNLLKFLIIFGIAALAFVEKITPNPKYGTVLYDLGQQYSKEDKHKRAMLYYQRALCTDPTLVGVNYLLGIASKRYGKTDDAIQYFYREIGNDCGSHESYYELNLIYAGRRAYREALAYIKKAIELRFENPMYHYAMGIAYVNTGYIVEASSQVDRLKAWEHYQLAEQLQREISEYNSR